MLPVLPSWIVLTYGRNELIITFYLAEQGNCLISLCGLWVGIVQPSSCYELVMVDSYMRWKGQYFYVVVGLALFLNNIIRSRHVSLRSTI